MDKILGNENYHGSDNDFRLRIEGFCDELKSFLYKLNNVTTPGAGIPEGSSQKASFTDSEKGKERDQSIFTLDISSLDNSAKKMLKIARKKEEELVTTKEMLGKSENLARLGLQVGGVVHELNNLVGSMMGYAQLAKLTGETQDITKCIDIALTTTQRARELLRQLRPVSRKNNTTDVMNINETIDSVFHLIEPAIKKKNIEISINCEAVPWLIGSAKAIRQSILMLVSSLIEDIPRGGTLNVSCLQSGKHVVIELAQDRNTESEKNQLPLKPLLANGKKALKVQPPIDEKEMNNIENMLNETNGNLECFCTEGKGFQFKVFLPIVS